MSDEEFEDLLDDDLESGEDEEPGSDQPAPQDTKKASSAPKSDEDPKDKRIRDLTSKWQKAHALATKHKSELERVVSGAEKAAPVQAEIPAELQAWFAEAREIEVDRVFASDPRFEEYGVTKEDLLADTPKAIKANADRFIALIDTMESRARSAALREAGISPEIVNTGRRGQPKVDWANIGSEDFEKEYARVKAGL